MICCQYRIATNLVGYTQQLLATIVLNKKTVQPFETVMKPLFLVLFVT